MGRSKAATKTKAPESIWVDPATGEIVDEGTEGAVELHLEAEERAAQRPDEDWLGDWLTRQHVHLNAEEAALKEQHKKRMGQIAARRSYLSWAYDKRIENVVTRALEGQRKRSVEFAFGSAGFRSSTKTDVTDEMIALSWAKEHAPDAIKKTPDKLLVSKLPKGDVPGVERRKVDTFFVRGAKGVGGVS